MLVEVIFSGQYYRNYFINIDPLKDVYILDNYLYIKRTRIPIRKNLIDSAIAEFNMNITPSGYAKLIFKIDSLGGYTIHKYCSNIIDGIAERICAFGMPKKFRPPCLGENNKR